MAETNEKVVNINEEETKEEKVTTDGKAVVPENQNQAPAVQPKKDNLIIRLGRKAKNGVKKHWKGFAAGAVTTLLFVGGTLFAIVKNSDGSETVIEVDPDDYDVSDIPEETAEVDDTDE